MDISSDPDGWVDGVPTSSEEQSCAFCDDLPVWVHPLDPARIAYREYGKGHTLPTFWTLCQRCEDLYDDHSDDAIVQLMGESAGWSLADANDTDAVNEVLRQPLAVFRAADLGPRRLVD